MSTRACYSFKATKHRPHVIIYIHHDGYCEGAAYYMYNALNLHDALTPDAFLRANDRAEITTEIHGDIDFHYKIDGPQHDSLVTFDKRTGWGSDLRWLPSVTMPVNDFIHQHYPRDWGIYSEFRVVELPYSRKRWFNKFSAIRYLLADFGKLRTLERWHGGPHENGGNWKSMVSECLTVIQAIPEVLEYENVKRIVDKIDLTENVQ